MMTPGDVIESYVRDVASYLPRDKRNDVAFELRALLHDELSAKAEAEGRAPDSEMVMQILAAFGRPADAAARYHPRMPLIDPADNHNFLIWALAGALLFAVAKPEDGSASLRWMAIVFLYFAVSAWIRRKRPSGRLQWRPTRGAFPEVASRPPAILAGLATLVFPFAMYLAPQTWWKTVSFGRSPNDGLELTGAFLQSWQRAFTLGGLALIVVTYAVAAAQGGWRFWSRRTLIGANLFVGTMLVVHAAPLYTLMSQESFTIFKSPLANSVAMPVFGAVGAMTVLLSLYDIYREWARVSPAPTLDGAAAA